MVNDYKDMAGAEAVAGQVRALGGRAIAVQADVGDSSQVKEMVRRALSEMGKIDVLVNNAGIYVRHEGGIVGLPDEAWQQVLDVNLSGVFYCCREVVPDMIRRKEGGKIINISSVQALLAHFEASAYQPAKAGVVALTKCLAVELAPHKINVNAIGPGAIASEGMGAMRSPRS
ncbi:MAG: SDR family oxidoreductase [Candidatus Latescibacteria bacterium]|nr:SDR family oxidoreductase [Candidatus Latescibacterota bacterium]